MGQWGAKKEYKGVVFLPYIETSTFEFATISHLISDVFILDTCENKDIEEEANAQDILLEIKNKYLGHPYGEWIDKEKEIASEVDNKSYIHNWLAYKNAILQVQFTNCLLNSIFQVFFKKTTKDKEDDK